MRIVHSEFTSPVGIREDFFTAEGAVFDTFREEAAALLTAYDNALTEYGCSRATEMLLRIHLSDVTNQYHILQDLIKDRSSFVSVVGQIPVDGRRIAIEAWHWHNAAMSEQQEAMLQDLLNGIKNETTD